jgi:predicted DNA-binding transcriptional regulator AlpA
VMEKVGLSRATIYRLRKKQDFPEPTRIHGSCVAWSEAEVDDWIRRRLMRRKPAFSLR